MVGDLALRAFPGHVEGHGTVAFRFQERVELRRTANRTIGDFHARQQCDETLQTVGSDGFAMRDHHHLLGSADDAEQFDGLNMRCGIDDHDVGQWRRIGDGRKRGRSRNENRLRRGENLRMLLMQAVQRNITGAGKRGMQQIGFLRTREQHVAQTAHGFLCHHRTDRTHMFHIDLGEPLRSALQCRPILIGNDRGGFHDVFERRGPPCQLQFPCNGIVGNATIVQIFDQLVEADRMEFTFQTGALRQNIKRLLIVIQGLQTLFDLIEINGFKIAALRGCGKHRIQRGHIPIEILLRFDNVIQLGGQYRPAAMRHEHMPLIGLLGHHQQRLMQVLHLGTDAQQTLGFLDVAATLPEAHGRTFGLALGLRLGRLDHGGNVTFENLRLEYVKHTAQVLQHHDLTAPLLRGRGNRESAGLYRTGHLLAGGGQHLAQQLNHTLVCAHRLLFGIQRCLIPCGVVLRNGVFAKLARTLQFRSPILDLVRDGMRGLLVQTHMRGRMGGQCRNLREILNRLVGGYTPLLTHAVKIAQITGQTRTHANQLIGNLIKTGGSNPRLEADGCNQLTVNRSVGTIIGDIQQLSAHFVCGNGLYKTTLLIGHTRHIEHRPSVHHATRRNRRGLLCGIVGDRTIHKQRMARGSKLRGVSDGIVRIADLILAMRIGIKRTVLRNFGTFQRFGGGLVSCQSVQGGIAGRTLRQLVDDLPAFHQHLRCRIHKASENNVPFDLKIRERVGRKACDGSEHRGCFRRAAFVIRTVEQLGLVQYDVVLAQHGGESRIQAYAPCERDHRTVFNIASFFAHLDRIHEYRHLVAFPDGHANHQRQFAHAADTAFRLTIVEHTLHTTPGGTQHAVVAEQGIKLHMPAGEQLRDAGRMRMRHVKLGAQLRHVLKRRRR